MHPGWPAFLIAITIAGVLAIIAWTRNEPPKFHQQLTAILVAIIAILIAATIWIAE
jgi:hypothetical protein